MDYTLSMPRGEIRPLAPEDQNWVIRILTEAWGSPLVVRRVQVADASQLPGFVAVYEGQNIGLAT